MNKAFIKKYGTLLLLATGAGIIFQLPYIRETFYVPIQNAMNLSNAQMGLLSSGYATMSLFSYFIGGIIADKFSARKLLTFSFIATGVLGLWFSTFPVLSSYLWVSLPLSPTGPLVSRQRVCLVQKRSRDVCSDCRKDSEVS